MAENESTSNEVTRTDDIESTTRAVTSRQVISAARKAVKRAERAERKTGSTSRGRRFTPARAVGTMAAVCALIAGVAIPAFAATQHESADASVSAREEASADAQTFEAADAVTADLTTTSYAARSADEIDQIHAEEEAMRRAAEEEQRRQQQDPGGGVPAGVPQTPTEPAPPAAVPGGWVNPLGGGYYISRSVGYGHQGADMVTNSQADWSVPIYAAKSGTVITSSEAVGGWGVTVAIDHGDGTQTLYGHMTYGSRAVGVGQHVEQGQLIGYVGSTGRSTAHHLHLELRINGAIVDPVAYLPI